MQQQALGPTGQFLVLGVVMEMEQISQFELDNLYLYHSDEVLGQLTTCFVITGLSNFMKLCCHVGVSLPLHFIILYGCILASKSTAASPPLALKQLGENLAT